MKTHNLLILFLMISAISAQTWTGVHWSATVVDSTDTSMIYRWTYTSSDTNVVGKVSIPKKSGYSIQVYLITPVPHTFSQWYDYSICVYYIQGKIIMGVGGSYADPDRTGVIVHKITRTISVKPTLYFNALGRRIGDYRGQTNRTNKVRVFNRF